MECSNSNGSSLGVPFLDTSLERKFKYPITATGQAKTRFLDYMSFNFQLKRAIEESNGGQPLADHVVEVSGSRVTTVEKDSSIRRMIAVEPTANMYLQQGLMRLIYKRLERVNLRLESLPTKHCQLAWQSSITSRNATIDFSSASDCVSTELLRWLIPKKWFFVIDQVRSHQMNKPDGSFFAEPSMISTMGNAGTFPLETLVFWALGSACQFTIDNPNSYSEFPSQESYSKVSVFGDDCILPTSTATLFINVCNRLGFMVNSEKSYYDDQKFRESCGGDYYHGFNVRAVYARAPVNRSISSLEPWLYVLFNGLLKKYISYFGPLTYIYDKSILRYFLELTRHYNLHLKIVPDDYPDDSGLKMSSDIQRLIACYPFRLDRIARSHHGTYQFKYCRFIYRTKLKTDDHLRFVSWLKKPIVEQDGHVPQRYRRRIGGYVVTKGISCQWHVPSLTRRG
jgi:hypothetical protein